MIFVQKYSKQEHLFGQQDFRVAVSDVYDDLFKTDNELGDGLNLTDIFIFESLNEDLELQDGRFAVDEMTFSIDSTSCREVTDQEAMFFTLGAANVNKNRYCALFFGSEPSLENIRFIGKVNSKISGDDLKWQSTVFNGTINPERKYKFSALSFDVSILEACSFNDDIYDENSQRINNVYERLFSTSNYQEMKSWCKYRFMYTEWGAINPDDNHYIYTTPKFNLKTYIDKIMSIATGIINEKIATGLTVSFAESDLGIEILPAKIVDAVGIGYYYLLLRLNGWTPDSDTRISLKIAEETFTANFSPIYLNRRMIHDRFGDDNDDLSIVNDIVKFKNSNSKNAELSFASLKNVAELLYSIARSLGCFVVLKYTATNTISIEFVNRRTIIADGLTYIVGAKDASFDASSNKESDGGLNYYGNANYSTWEGLDLATYPIVANDFSIINEYKDSEIFQKQNKYLTELKEQKKVENKRILFTISPTLVRFISRYVDDNVGYSFESCKRSDYKEDWSHLEYDNFYHYPESPAMKNDTLHTGIFIHTLPLETTTPAQPFFGCYRPAAAIIANINGSDKIFTELGQYVNEIYQVTQEYYQTEYSLTVPYWNGFNDIAGFSGASWKKIKRGSKIALSETVKRYNDESGLFEDQTSTKNYVVTGIETNLQYPETKIKLLDISAFEFGHADEIPNVPSFSFGNPTPVLSVNEEANSQGYLIQATSPASSIAKGDAVMIMDDGTIQKAVNHSDNYSKTFGIALASGVSGERILIQTGGRVDLVGTYNFTIGDLVVLRKNDSGLNVSQTLLQTKTSTENMITFLGVADTATSFILKIKELIFE